MHLSRHDAALLRDLKHQPQGLIWVYILVGVVGLGMALLIEFEPRLRVLVAFLSGGLTGLAAEKLVSRQIRAIAYRLLQHTQQSMTDE